jgi:hypothetical protein
MRMGTGVGFAARGITRWVLDAEFAGMTAGNGALDGKRTVGAPPPAW